MNLKLVFAVTLLSAGNVCAGMSFASGVHASTLRGRVVGADGGAVAQAMVTVRDERDGYAESVFTDDHGEYKLVGGLSGQLNLRVRKPYYRDIVQGIVLVSGQETHSNLTLKRLESDQEISDSLPALFHFDRISFQATGPFDRANFQRDCLTCHQLGNAHTRLTLPPEGWDAIVKQMHGWLGNFDSSLRQQRAELLSMAFDGRPLSVRPVFPSDPSLSKVKIYEYRLDQAVVPHDADINPNDGHAYIVDEGADQMIIVDLEKHTKKYVPEPSNGSPVGGKFGQPLLFNMAVRRGPHSLALGPDHRYYVTDAFAGGLSVFNPKNAAWEEAYDAGPNSRYSHTVRIAKNGDAWFTVAFSDQVGRFDSKTRRVEVIDLPKMKPVGIAAVTTPYGLDISPIDGTVWYARLYGDKIGRIDPKTKEVVEYDSPVKGPRRIRFDRNGELWVAGFNNGELARISTTPFHAKIYALPTYSPGAVPAPYAVAIDPDTQDVWITEIMTDQLFRFVPSEERFYAYPLPLRGSYTRDLSFTRDGRVCTSNNPVPKAALEGGVLELICIGIDKSGASTSLRYQDKHDKS